MRDFIIFIVKQIVDHPDKVILDQEQIGEKIIFKLQVASEDVGKVVGRNGKHAMALRILLSAVAAREGKKAGLEIVD